MLIVHKKRKLNLLDFRKWYTRLTSLKLNFRHLDYHNNFYIEILSFLNSKIWKSQSLDTKKPDLFYAHFFIKYPLSSFVKGWINLNFYKHNFRLFIAKSHKIPSLWLLEFTFANKIKKRLLLVFLSINGKGIRPLKHHYHVG